MITVNILVLLLVCLKAQKDFQAIDNQKLIRAGQPAVTPNGKFVIYNLRSWDQSTGKVSSYLQMANILTKEVKNLTQVQIGQKDSTPVINQAFQNIVFFLSNRNGKNQIWYINYIEMNEPTQLTNYEIDVDNLKLAKDGYSLFFTSQVYIDCEDMACVQKRDQIIENRGSNTWQTYDQLFVRHWDEWLTDKISHIFKQELDYEQNGIKYNPILKNKPIDCMKGNKTHIQGMRTNSPVPPDGGAEQFDISADGSNVVFTGQDRTKNESWTTGWKIYESNITNINHLTPHIEARTQDPKYSPNQQKIAFLSMKRPMYESDQLTLQIYDKKSNQFKIITGSLDQSVEDYNWQDDNTISFVSTVEGLKLLYSVSLEDNNSVRNTFKDEFISASVPLKVSGQKFQVMMANSFLNPDELFILNESKLESLVKFNDMSQFYISNPENFIFYNKGHKIQGWVFKPINFNESNSYPLAYLIHGGPESPFLSSWSYRWNPQIFTSNGYAVLMINPHGSPGMGQDFTDAVINDWGGVPFSDIMQGFYNVRQYDWIDTHRACALGASYGGFMVNWIQGNTDAFKCLVTHDGVFSNLNMFYSSEELWFNMAENCPLNHPGCKIYEEKSRQNFFKFSPETKVDNFQTPHLVIHGSKDFRIPISEGIGMFTALQLKGVPSKFLHFTEENHWVLKAENSIKWYQEVVNWLDKYSLKTEYPNGKPHQDDHENDGFGDEEESAEAEENIKFLNPHQDHKIKFEFSLEKKISTL